MQSISAEPRRTKRRMTADERAAMERESLSRAVGYQSTMNYGPIVHGFMEKGIPADQIEPRSNVFTYHAWRALGRQVRKGEHGVKITSMIPVSREVVDVSTGEKKTEGRKLFTTATVFHVSQTDPIEIQAAG